MSPYDHTSRDAQMRAARKKMNDMMNASSAGAQSAQPKPKHISPVLQRIQANAAKFKPGGERYQGPAVTEPGDKHENEAETIARMVSDQNADENIISRAEDNIKTGAGAEHLTGSETEAPDEIDATKLSAAIRQEMESRIISKIEEEFTGKAPTSENLRKLEQLILANADAPFVAVVDKKVRCFVITRFSISISDSEGVVLPNYENKGGGGFTPYAVDTFQGTSVTHFTYQPIPMIPARVYDGHFAVEIRLDERKLDECSGYKGKT